MFVFDVSQIIKFDEYCFWIGELKKSFENQKEKLLKTYNVENGKWNGQVFFYNMFRSKYRILRQKFIIKIIDKFRRYLPKECLIYEFGSLVKHTDRIESDVDLTFCYDERKTNQYESIEELIDYSISRLFDSTIDHVHGKFQHYPHMSEFNNIPDSENKYILSFGSNQIQFKCGPYTLSENLMNIKNVRDYHSLINGYKEKYLLKCNIDCLYSVFLLENSTSYDFLLDLATLENDNDIFSDYSYNFKKYVFDSIVKISDLKKAFKNAIVDMYIMISYTRKKLNWLRGYSMNMDNFFNSYIINCFFGTKYLETLKGNLCEMIFYWDKIELLLKEFDILLSTRSKVEFGTIELNKMLLSKYYQNDMMFYIENSINSLNNIVDLGWRIINEKR